MHDSKLFLLLKSLDVAAFKNFRHFLESPYHNRDPNVKMLYECIARYYPRFNSSHLDKVQTFRRIFPEQPFDLNKMRKLMSAMTGLVEDYLILLEFESDAYQRKKYLSNAAAGRNLPGYFEKINREMALELDTTADLSPAQYLRQLDLNAELFYHPGTDKQRLGSDFLIKAMDNLDAFYLLTKLQLAAEMRTRENILSETYSICLLDESIREAERHFAGSNPMIRLYLYIMALYQQSDITVLAPALALFKDLRPRTNKKDRQIMLQLLLNHGIRRLNGGEMHYKQYVFDLYQQGVEEGLLFDNNQITELAFSNIVTIGTSLKAFEWVQYFINEYTASLKPEIQQDIKSLSLSLLYFSKEDYQQAELSLQGSKFSDTLNLLKARCLLIRIWFEQFLLDDRNYFFLLDQIDSFEKFVRRQKKIASHKTAAYLNFVKWTKKLVNKHYRHEKDPDLHQQIGASEAFFYKEWLLEKVRQI